MLYIGVIFNAIFTLFLLFIAVCIIIRIFRDCIGKEITVNAKLYDKYSCQSVKFNKYTTVPDMIYILVFDADGIMHKFKVNSLTYLCAEKGQTGILKYKGNRYIDFN